MEACWHQNRRKIYAICEKRFFKKSCSRCSGGLIFEVLGVEVGSKHPSKNDQKMESRWEDILASIFNGFWLIFGRKLGRKMEPRSIQEGTEKAMEKWKAPRWPGDPNFEKGLPQGVFLGWVGLQAGFHWGPLQTGAILGAYGALATDWEGTRTTEQQSRYKEYMSSVIGTDAYANVQILAGACKNNAGIP